MSYTIAGIDIHKKVVMVVATDVTVEGEWLLQSARFGTTAQERQHLVEWLRERGVQEVVMESTAQYWKPVWLELEPHVGRLHLAQAHSNRAPKGRKHDFGDAERLVRRLVAGELRLSFVPDAEQRQWRGLERGKLQVVRDRVRLHNQLEALLEETRMKLSSVLSDLLGQSGRRILQALAEGHTDPVQLAALGDDRLKCSKEELADALRGQFEPIHRQLLQMFLERLAVLDRHLQRFDELIGEALQEHAQAVIRLAEIPGFGPDSAQQLIAEIGPEVKAFPSAGEFAAWIGICPGSDESAEQNRSSHSPKGNPFVRRLFTQAAQAAVKKQGSHFQSVFRRWLPRLHYQGAIWAVGHKLARLVWKILHDRVHYIEQGEEPNPRAKKRRAQKMVQALRRMGYKVEISPLTPAPAAAQA
jgi:transposase